MTFLLLFLRDYVNNVPAATVSRQKHCRLRGTHRGNLHDFSVCDRGPIILEVGKTSIILFDLLGPKVGKLVKRKTLSHSPAPGTAHRFHNVTSKRPSKNSQYVSSLSVKRFEKLKNFQIANQK